MTKKQKQCCGWFWIVWAINTPITWQYALRDMRDLCQLVQELQLQQKIMFHSAQRWLQ